MRIYTDWTGTLWRVHNADVSVSYDDGITWVESMINMEDIQYFMSLDERDPDHMFPLDNP